MSGRKYQMSLEAGASQIKCLPPCNRKAAPGQGVGDCLHFALHRSQQGRQTGQIKSDPSSLAMLHVQLAACNPLCQAGQQTFSQLNTALDMAFLMPTLLISMAARQHTLYGHQAFALSPANLMLLIACQRDL